MTTKNVFPLALVAAVRLAGCVSGGKRAGDAAGNLVEVTVVDPHIQVALKDNRAGRRAYLVRPAAEALARAAGVIEREKGYVLLVTDAYRPNPGPASPGAPAGDVARSRGCAVEVSLYDPVDKREADMSEEQAQRPGGIVLADPSAVSVNRAWRKELLRSVMEEAGFEKDRERWSRFTLKGCERYPILEVSPEKR